MDRPHKIALVTTLVGALVLALKYGAYVLTGSVALYSDALESVINVVAAGAAFLALRVSARPADPEHTYGNHKAEYFSAVFEGVLVVLAALAIAREAYLGFLHPKPPDAPALGLAVNAAASVINGFWSWLLIRLGRRWRSLALVADGRHVLTDVYTSAGVLLGVALVALTGWLALDPTVAGLVALNILWAGWRMVREGAGGLMDEAAPPEIVDRVRALIADRAGGALEAHDLRTRHAGRVTFVEFHLVVPSAMRVGEAHAICDRVEEALREDVGETRVTIHVEPEEKAKRRGVLVLS